MKIWIDAQLPPTLANWVSTTFELEASALRDLSLRDAQDIAIFEAARAENAVIMTKDSFHLVLWMSCRSSPEPWEICWRKFCC